jgi:hypothetical protein
MPWTDIQVDPDLQSRDVWIGDCGPGIWHSTHTYRACKVIFDNLQEGAYVATLLEGSEVHLGATEDPQGNLSQ